MAAPEPALDIAALRSAYQQHADADRAVKMAGYMKDQFPFFGLSAATRRAAMASTKAAAKVATADEIVEFARLCWEQPEREFHYAGSDLLGWNVAKLGAGHLEDVEYLISTNSWWDTVDALASWSVGGLVAANPELTDVMDEWIYSDNMWIARTAILHQLRYKTATDTERLFRYVEIRASDTEFFIRKALGWALRQYAHTDPDAISVFVADNEHKLSGLTKREAIRNIT
jgi:3-methyladenine DNA glycosylase AlkD